MKGVQRLSQLREIAKFEAQRQLMLVKISEELKRRGVREEDLEFKTIDVTEIFEESKSDLIKKLMKNGRGVYAVKLRGFGGLLGLETAPDYRLGKEMAERVRFWTDVKGLFHTDELPNYGVSEEDVERLRRVVNAEKEDAVVFIVASRGEAEEALEKVVERAREALYGPPYETRGPKNGKTVYLRPRPGMARMYPETDIPPIKITDELIRELDREPLVHPRVKIAELMEKGLSEQLSWQIYDSKYYNLFLRLIKEIKKVKPTFIASILTETVKNLEREGFNLENVSDEKLFEVFKAIENDLTAKESIPEILKELSNNPFEKVDSVVDKLGLRKIKEEELAEIINVIVRDNVKLIEKMGFEKAFKKVMGVAMKTVRGKADSKKVAELVKKRVCEVLNL